MQTRPGQGWTVILPLYGHEQAWFDQTWRPSEIQALDLSLGAPGGTPVL